MQNLECVLQQMHTPLMALTSYEANDIVANSRKNPSEAWRRLQKRHDPTTGGRKRNLLRTIISLGRCSLLELQAVIELDHEMKLAGLGALVLEELEKHLILNSNRLRTFEDARLEVLTYAETKFGLRIRDAKPNDTVTRGQSDPMDVDAVNSLTSSKEKGSSSPRNGCFKCGGAHFQRDCNARNVQASNRMAKANRASHGPRVSPHCQAQAQARVKKTRGNPKDNLKEPKVRTKVPKAYTRAEHRKLVSQVLKTRNRRLHSHVQVTQWNDGWSFDEWNDDRSSVGWHKGWEQTYDTSASSFSLGGLDVSATNSPKRFEWVKMNLDTAAAVNKFPLNFGPDGAGDGIFYRTASGECIFDGGAWKFQGYDERGLLGSLNGRLTGVHKVLCSAAEIACKGRQDFYLGHDGGYMVPIHRKIGQGMRLHFEKLANWYGKNELIPVYLENNIFNFYLNREVKSTETNTVNDADHCPAKNCQQSANGDGRAVRSEVQRKLKIEM